MTTVATPLAGQTVLTSATGPSVGKLNVYDATSAALNVTLPQLSGLSVGARISVQKHYGDASSHAVTVSCYSGDTRRFTGADFVDAPDFG